MMILFFFYFVVVVVEIVAVEMKSNGMEAQSWAQSEQRHNHKTKNDGRKWAGSVRIFEWNTEKCHHRTLHSRFLSVFHFCNFSFFFFCSLRFNICLSVCVLNRTKIHSNANKNNDHQIWTKCMAHGTLLSLALIVTASIEWMWGQNVNANTNTNVAANVIVTMCVQMCLAVNKETFPITMKCMYMNELSVFFLRFVAIFFLLSPIFGVCVRMLFVAGCFNTGKIMWKTIFSVK